MARAKMFDPAYLKSFTEAINKENKIRESNYLEVVGGIPRKCRVDFQADFDSDESDCDEEKTEQKATAKTARDSRGKGGPKESQGRSDGDPLQTPGINSPDDRKDTKTPIPATARKTKVHWGKLRNLRYVFPICNFCDFGWNYASRKYVVCPEHGPFRRTQYGYSPAIKDYLKQQLRRDVETKDQDKRLNKMALSLKFFL